MKRPLTVAYVKRHRKEIDACINKHSPGVFGRINDDVRYNWLRIIKPVGKCHEGIECNKICKREIA